MTAYRSNVPIYANPTAALRCSLVPSHVSGKVNCVWPNGTVCSIQPDGREETRPAGTDGGYEQAAQIGTRLVYDYAEMTCPPVMFDIVVTS